MLQGEATWQLDKVEVTFTMEGFCYNMQYLNSI